jgi:hypothetical protein
MSTVAFLAALEGVTGKKAMNSESMTVKNLLPKKKGTTGDPSPGRLFLFLYVFPPCR